VGHPQGIRSHGAVSVLYDLLITLVAVGVLYALRVVAETAEDKRQ
jgi:hypothetical protein